jgi:NhaP-type Na+/H+ or K+/H+ antiporter
MKEVDKQSIYAPTSVISVIVSLIGAYISLSKLFDWTLVKNVFQHLWIQVVLTAISLLIVLRLVSVSLFAKNSAKSFFPKNTSKKDS